MDSLIVQATWSFCSAVTSSFWLERRREFAYLYFLQPFLAVVGWLRMVTARCHLCFVFSFG